MARGRKAHKARKKAQTAPEASKVPEAPKDPSASGERLVDKPAAKPASKPKAPSKPKLVPDLTPAVDLREEIEQVPAEQIFPVEAEVAVIPPIEEVPISKPPEPESPPELVMGSWQRFLAWIRRA